MCRSIQTLHRAQAPATAEEMRAAALQFVRKVSGYRQPSKANTAAFERAVAGVEAVIAEMLGSLEPRRTGGLSAR